MLNLLFEGSTCKAVLPKQFFLLFLIKLEIGAFESLSKVNDIRVTQAL